MEIYKKIDKNLKKNKDKLILFAKSKGYGSYAEYIHIEYQTRTAQNLHDEIKEYGIIKPPSLDSIWHTVAAIKNSLKDNKPIEIINKKKCRRCKKKPIAKGNWRFCKDCHANNKKISIGFDESYNPRIMSFGCR